MRVVDRAIEVALPVTVEVEVPVTPKGAGWIAALHELARQLNTGRTYDPDLPELNNTLNELMNAYARRPAIVALQRTGRDWSRRERHAATETPMQFEGAVLQSTHPRGMLGPTF